MLDIDHFVFGTADLERGTAWMSTTLGVPPAGGGRHPAMSTHNALWRLGPAYLEVIAIDPDAPDPRRKRWFALDDPAMRATLRTEPCAFLTWVAASRDLGASRAACAHDPGPALTFTRDDLRWKLTVPVDGRLNGSGTVPHLIEWPEPARAPGRVLPDQGLKIAEFAAAVRPATRDLIERMGAAGLIRLAHGEDRLVLAIRRPDGRIVTFRSRGSDATSSPFRRASRARG